MQLKDSTHNSFPCVEVSGDIDMNHAPQLHQHLVSQVPVAAGGKMVLDMKDVGYIDSSGIATLVDIVRQLREKKSDLVLLQPQPKIMDVFEIVRLEDFFTIEGLP